MSTAIFSDATRAWFEQAFDAPTPVQARGWEVVGAGGHALLVAPTGSGKTLAAFLWSIDALARLAPDAPPGVRVVYVSPLKALVYDVERNLRVPLAGIRVAAERLGVPMRAPSVDVRTGDTPARERRRQAREPGDILVTTPESLFLLLGSQAREGFRGVHTIIVDEIHALAPSKRGAHLALSLERLAELTERDPQRIGLSATVRPPDEVARYLGGDRAVDVVDASAAPRIDVSVTVPVADMARAAASYQPPARPGGSILADLYAREVGTPPSEKGIWPAIYPEVLERVLANRSTIVFVNSRGLCERLAQRLNELAGEELVRAHHGSVSHEKRAEIEEALKAGKLRGIVATSSLELGIDMGAVDHVVLVESPGSVARGVQRIGRAGHRADATSVGSIFPKFRGDLLECAVIAERMRRGEIEAIAVPRNPLDVLAQQIVAMCCDAPRTGESIARVVRRAYAYRDLSPRVLDGVLDMLSGSFPSTELADLRPRLAWDRSADVLSARRGTAMISRLNAGTIPDRGNYAVHAGEDGPRIGELDEEMVFETRAGENVLLGATTWRVEQITRDRVIVSPAPGEPGRLPFWRGDGPGRPLELGRALGAFVREIGALARDDAVRALDERTPLDRFAAENVADYLAEQRAHTGTLPTDRAITVERFRDELGDWRVCVLTPFGARVHAPWALALQHALGESSGVEVQIMYTDDGLVLRLADTEELPPLDALLPDPDELESFVTAELAESALFAALFRENAVRALLMPRRDARSRNPLWSQRLKAKQLLATVRRFESFPLVLETYRQALADVFDLPGLERILRAVRGGEIRVHDVETPSASPFARSLVFAYVAAYIYEQDAPIAERKAQALTLDRDMLRELLGQAELRDLMDAHALAELEEELQGLVAERLARDRDELEDRLRRLGDLTEAEAARRCAGDAVRWLGELEGERRAVVIAIAGERRWIAAGEAGLYRDALGCPPPPGLPESCLVATERALEQLVARFARTHGPFRSAELARRFGLTAAQVEPPLEILERAGKLVRGELRPGGGPEPEWCDAGVMRSLKRRTLARLRNEAAAVDAEALARFLPAWHGVGAAGGAMDALEEAVAKLEGLALPWRALCDVLLPARVPGFKPDMLDLLSTSGRVVWVGHSRIGAADGRVALYRREQAAKLLELDAAYEPPGPAHAAVLAHLATRGASFLTELERAVRTAHPEVDLREFEAMLWDLVWAGRITNDTFQPLRSLGRRAPRARAFRAGATMLAGGRWSLVEELADATLGPTERAVARAGMLLERYGIVSREAARAEDLSGGFAPVYKVLKAMEEAGRVRRGHFVDGLSGAQFAHVGAVERLRAARTDETAPDGAQDEPIVALAAVDPANPYGALLPWPATGAGEQPRPRRVPGAWVLLRAGMPVLYVHAGGRQLLTFPTAHTDWHTALAAALASLSHLPHTGRRRLTVIEKIDGIPARESPYRDQLRESGFVPDYRGFTLVHDH